MEDKKKIEQLEREVQSLRSDLVVLESQRRYQVKYMFIGSFIGSLTVTLMVVAYIIFIKALTNL